MAVKLIIDSTADMPKNLKDRCTVVPLTVCFGTREYTDGVDLDHKTFYEMLIESDQLPSTSQATPAAFTRTSGLISFRNSSTSSSVAPPVENPVDVLI